MAEKPTKFENVEQILEAFGDMFGEFFGSLHPTIAITPGEAAAGLTREITITHSVPCAPCGGRGSQKPGVERVPCATCKGSGGKISTQGLFHTRAECPTCKGAKSTVEDPCGTCHGGGQLRRTTTAPVVVPAGATDGQQVMVADTAGNQVAVTVRVRDPEAQAAAAREAQQAFADHLRPAGLPTARTMTPEQKRRETAIAWASGAVAVVLVYLLLRYFY